MHNDQIGKTASSATAADRDARDNRLPVQWRHDRAVVISPDGAEVWQFGSAGPVRLGGRNAGPLAAAVDGQRSLDEIVARAAIMGMPVDDAERIARRWLAAGHLVSALPAPAPLTIRLIDQSSDTGSVDGHQHNPLSARLATALTLAGLIVVEAAANDAARETEALALVLVDDLLETVKATATWTEPVIALQLRGDRPLVSPLLYRGAACPLCLEERLRLRRAMDLVAANRVGRDLPPPSPLLHTAAIPLAAGVVAGIARSCREQQQTTPLHQQHLAVIFPATGRVEHHPLTPVAGCPACDPGGVTVTAAHLSQPVRVGVTTTAAAPVTSNLQSGEGGGFRVVDPAETWERYAPLISDVIGLVPSLAATGPSTLRAFSAGPNIAAADDLTLLRSRLRSCSGGKGLTLTAARTGALAEALERDSLRARGREPYRRARMADLEGAIHPNDIQLFSALQLQQAEALWALGLGDQDNGRGMHRVPRPFDISAEHDWSRVADIRSGRLSWLPSSLVWFGWPNRPPGYPAGSSNGAAAGNTIEEALLQGLLELVERDAVALWWYPRCRRPAIDLAAWNDPRIEAALAPQRALGSDVWVLDLTTDLGIPAAVAIAVGVAPLPQVPLFGFGAHLDPLIAVVRALTELAQMQAPLAAHDPALPLELPGSAERLWFAGATPANEPWLLPHGLVTPAAAPAYTGIGAALDDAVNRIAARGIDVLWADCTRPDIGLPVVRTWAPGLRHFWNRFAPGRLYDVPPAIGWCEPGYGEADLNPWAMIL